MRSWPVIPVLTLLAALSPGCVTSEPREPRAEDYRVPTSTIRFQPASSGDGYRWHQPSVGVWSPPVGSMAPVHHWKTPVGDAGRGSP